MRDFEYLAYRAFSWMLLLVLVVLPLQPIFASEPADAAAPASVAEPPATESASLEPETEPQPTQDPTAAVEEEPQSLDTEVVPPTNPENETISPEDGNASEEEPAPADVAAAGTTTVREGGDINSPEDGTATTSEPGTASSTLPQVPTDDVPIVDTETGSTTPVQATSSDPMPPSDDTPPLTPDPSSPADDAKKGDGETVPVNAVTNNDNRFTFNKDECIKVGNGSFYCSDAEEDAKPVGTDRVFAAPDKNGDREIYIEKGGELDALTDNNVDDDAPFYDEVSNSVVWQRLVDGRYQIVEYDLDKNTEHVITNDRFNNMQPSRYGDITVWQAWIGNDWEIMLDENGEVSMVTDNDYHDVSPRINGTYIVWQAFEDNAWRVKVFDTVSKKTETIGNADGASAENPRFVLVYDTKQQNGDVETRGYDLQSKQVVPLHAEPAPAPKKLPNPDQTGENRALVQIPVQVKTKTDGDPIGDTPIAMGDGPDPETGTTTGDIVVPAAGAATSTGSTAMIDDLIVQPATASTTTATDHIEDVIIAPFVEPAATSDSQSGVASST